MGKSRKRIRATAVVLLLAGCLTGCASNRTESPRRSKEPTKVVAVDKMSPTKQPERTKSPVATKSPKKTALPEEAKAPKKQSRVIVIDAGHQLKQNTELEAIAPGSKEKKKKVSSGTQGRYTRVPEYEVTLSVSKQLKSSLEALGYQVIMTRETNDVDLSNIERAKIANAADADVFLRIHCNGIDKPSVNGALTLCPTKDSPYCKSIYPDSYALAKDVLSEMVKSTGAKDRGITKTDTMSGINWSKVPVTIVEMGYMSNEEEDKKLVSKAYQKLLVQGITNGIIKYFDEK